MRLKERRRNQRVNQEEVYMEGGATSAVLMKNERRRRSRGGEGEGQLSGRERRTGVKHTSCQHFSARREEERGRNVLESVQQRGSGTVRQRGGQEGAREEEEDCKVFPSGKASARYKSRRHCGVHLVTVETEQHHQAVHTFETSLEL